MKNFLSKLCSKIKVGIEWIKDKFAQFYFDDGSLNEDLKEKYDDL